RRTEARRTKHRDRIHAAPPGDFAPLEIALARIQAERSRKVLKPPGLRTVLQHQLAFLGTAPERFGIDESVARGYPAPALLRRHVTGSRIMAALVAQLRP